MEKKKVKIPTEIRILMLNEIFSCFHQITQYYPHQCDYVGNYFERIKGTISMMEGFFYPGVHVGSFAMPLKKVTGFDLYDRFLNLVRENKDEKHIKKITYFSLKNMTLYFNMQAGFREKFRTAKDDAEMLKELIKILNLKIKK